MQATELAQLAAFAAVAEQLSFRQAARRLNTSASALSRTIKAMERRIGVPLFNRTTRSVSLTAAGRVLAEQALPALATLRRATTSIDSTANDPAGEVRINLTQLAAQIAFASRMGAFSEAYPRVRVELVVDDQFDDIIARGCDAGVRLRTAVAADMVAIPVTGPLPVAIVGSPGYFAARPAPHAPAELAAHRAVLYRWGADRAAYRWNLLDGAGTIDVTPDAQFAVSDADVMVRMAEAGAGLVLTLLDRVEGQLAAGTLIRVLAEHCPVLSPFCLYFPAGRQSSTALRAVTEFFRQRQTDPHG